MLLYPFAILSKDLIDLGYKMCNNVLVERDEKITKLNLAQKENLIWYAINILGRDSIISGDDLKEVKEALNSSVLYSKEKV